MLHPIGTLTDEHAGLKDELVRLDDTDGSLVLTDGRPVSRVWIAALHEAGRFRFVSDGARLIFDSWVPVGASVLSPNQVAERQSAGAGSRTTIRLTTRVLFVAISLIMVASGLMRLSQQAQVHGLAQVAAIATVTVAALLVDVGLFLLARRCLPAFSLWLSREPGRDAVVLFVIVGFELAIAANALPASLLHD